MITIYSKSYCPYCTKAKQFLKNKGVSDAIHDIDVTNDEALQAELVNKSGGRRTVPQIFIGDTHIGGYDDMIALDKAGKLDALLVDSVRN